ncbi:glycosyltransferase [Rhodohalobacter sp. SW132]|uniref:glycosyltransferase family 2 protein n=1 Tax=Rhodohalobacter sp. SW132 TaxID=2293433 RepID=UPI000E242BFD|nr:glycosyltransferase [Rhodohalobacter sp. SW132]REL24198.1 glycosyltransferase [Rhodohalobacter sp. SW132]
MGIAPIFSVIIPVYNNWEQLQLCLDALSKQTVDSEKFEIIVVDNASTRSRPDHFRMPDHAILKFESEPGSYAARNRGAEFANGKYLAFTDSDCIPDKNWLQHAFNLFEESRCDSIGGEIKIFRTEDGRKHAYIYESYNAFKQEQWVPEGKSCTANHFVKKKVFNEVNGFDTTLKSGGDWEFSNRCVSLGYQMEYGADVIVLHPARKNLKAMLKKHYRHICWASVIVREKYNCGQLRVLLSSTKGALLGLFKKKPYVKNLKHRFVLLYIDFIKMGMQIGVNVFLLMRLIKPEQVRE